MADSRVAAGVVFLKGSVLRPHNFLELLPFGQLIH